ncbi:hypothetical protein EV189_2887 [Motilibacter rhizosphaerae]|uniref:Uncharacterized protein n=1 Tax=Motilibacter rhizosphaerae TaxID=598652 RepID=A0A4Q7NR00_9ACTN|nr:gephyrin-like molybdotransferase receptor GlpR [Motilibacter rhizosphaerae]RZS87456.1 hypothetical protein EV189_2887 [Motilibacter rhizosphaerae]
MTGLIFGTIIAAWAAVLVPMWLRRHDERNEARSAERFSTAMRVLSRRGSAARPPVPGRGRSVVMPERQRVADVHVTGPARPRRSVVPLRAVRSAVVRPVQARVAARPAAAERPTARPAPARTAPARGAAAPAPRAAARPGPRSATARPASARPGAPRPSRPRPGRTSLVVRRRRTLLGLAALVALTGLLGLAGVLPLWPAVLAVLLLAAYVVHLRAQARVTAQAARRRSATAQRTAARQVRLGTAERLRRAARRHLASPGAEEAPLEDLLAEDGGWDPREVPLPTYVTKPAAPRLPDTAVSAFWGDAERDDLEVAAPAAPRTPPPVVDEADEALDDELGAILERRRVVGE